MTPVVPVTATVFRAYQTAAMTERSHQLRLNLATELPRQTQGFITASGRAGFGVTPSGELVSLFSADPGEGDELVLAAIRLGATNLNCYDGYLPGFYARLGFVEVERVSFADEHAPNGWTYGRPDVVFMALPAAAGKVAA